MIVVYVNQLYLVESLQHVPSFIIWRPSENAASQLVHSLPDPNPLLPRNLFRQPQTALQLSEPNKKAHSLLDVTCISIIT